MSFTLRYTQTLSSAGNEVVSQDITGSTAPDAYGKNGNIAASDVTATYTKIARLTDINDVTTLTSGGAFIQYREYIKTAGNSSTIDGKAMTVGSKLIPRNNILTVPSGDTWQSTGYVFVPSDYLPSDTAPYYVSIEDLDQLGSYIADDLYVTDYSVFYDGDATYPNVQTINGGTAAAAYDGATYFVTAASVSYKGNTYYVNESFVASDTTDITPASGATIWIQYASTTYYKPLLYQINNDLYSLINAAMAQNIYGHEDLNRQILSARAVKEGLEYAAYTNNVSFVQAEDNINYLNAQIDILNSEIGI